MRSLAAVLLAAASLALVSTAAPVPSSCGTVTPNPYPFYTDAPKFVSSMPGASRWEVGPPDQVLPVINLHGSPYEMGVQYGTLMRAEITQMVPEAFAFIEQEIGQYLNFLPPELRKAIEQFGVEAALNITRDVTKAYTPQRYFDIVAGMANATGINNDHLMNLVLFPELIKAGCSMIGAWGKATAGGAGGLIQLRALDWTTNGPFQKFPVLINWHPTQQPGAPFAGFNHTVLSWAGLVGAITGWSASGISISEKVWLQYSGVENIVGEPFTFVLQDMLWGEANPNQPTTAPYWDIDACLAKVASTNRTCSIWMGIGDTKSSSFRMVSYGFEQVNIYNDVNFPFYPPWHQQFDDLVFVNKHVQPSHDSCMNDLIAQAYGAMTAADVLHITSSDHSGDMHAAIMDHGTGYMYVSNASPYVNGTVTPAYARQFIRVDMQWAWTS